MNTFSYTKRTQKRKHTPPPVAGHLPPKRKQPQRRVSDESQDIPLTGAFGSALFALPCMVVMGFLLLMIATLVAYRSQDPSALRLPLCLTAQGLTCVLGGLIAARRGGGHPLLSGLLCGLFWTLLLFITSLFWSNSQKSLLSLGLAPLLQWGIHGGMVLLSLLGARIGVGRR